MMAPKKNEPSQLRIAGADEMFTVYRIEERGPDVVKSSPLLTFRETLAIRVLHISSRFAEEGWPPFRDRVAVVGDDGNSWVALLPEFAASLEAAGHPPEKEVPGQFELGLNFITRRVPPLTQYYWLLEEWRACRRFLDAPDADTAAYEAFSLGQCVMRAHLHARHLPSVRKRVKQARPLAEENSQNRVKSGAWKTAACTIAKEIWARNPSLTAEAVAPKVKVELERRGLMSAKGGPPSHKSIRIVISAVNPKVKEK